MAYSRITIRVLQNRKMWKQNTEHRLMMPNSLRDGQLAGDTNGRS